MRYNFIIPKYQNHSNEGYYMVPQGIGYIMAVLKRSGREVVCYNLNEHVYVDMSVAPSRRSRSFYGKFDPRQDIILTGGLSVHFQSLYNIIRDAKVSGLQTILGGGVISADPEFIFEEIGPTYGVIGEGEETVLELAQAIEDGCGISGVKGIIYKDTEGTTKRTEKRESIKDLDSLPYPEHDMIGTPELLSRLLPTDEPYFHTSDTPRMMPMITSRSCPYDCSFCFHPLGRGYRKRSLSSIFEEIEFYLDKYHPNIFLFLDELIGAEKTRMMEFCDRIKKYNVAWICQLRVDNVDDEMLKKMKESGCSVISYGIESINDNCLKEMNKKTTKDQIEKALELTYKNNIGIQGNLIFGTNGETAESVKESLGWWNTHQKYALNLMQAVPYPGTLMYDMALQKGVIGTKKDFLINRCPPVNVCRLSDAEYTEMLTTVSNRHQQILEYHIKPEITHGETLTISYTCPHCQSKCVLKNMPPKLWMGGRSNLRYACRTCNQRTDLEV